MQDSVRRVLQESESLQGSLPPAAALREWNYLLAWQLRIWQDLPSCIATATSDDSSPVSGVAADLVRCTGGFLRNATAVGAASATVDPQALFELITAVAWAIDRFGDDAEQARERVDLATAGVFRTP
jgi:hypothetical protein